MTHVHRCYIHNVYTWRLRNYDPRFTTTWSRHIPTLRIITRVITPFLYSVCNPPRTKTNQKSHEIGVNNPDLQHYRLPGFNRTYKFDHGNIILLWYEFVHIYMSSILPGKVFLTYTYTNCYYYIRKFFKYISYYVASTCTLSGYSNMRIPIQTGTLNVIAFRTILIDVVYIYAIYVYRGIV